MHVLMVCKDRGPTGLQVPLARLLEENGDKLTLVVEGLAGDIFMQAGFNPFFKGTVNYEEIDFNLDVGQLVDYVQPDVVVVSCGKPIHLEKRVLKAANRRKVPCAIMEDFWGNSKRAGYVPQLLLVLDEYAERIAIHRHGDWLKSGRLRVAQVGNHGVPFSTTPSAEAQVHFRKLHHQYGEVHTFLGGGADYTSSEIHLLMRCLQRTPRKCCLVPRFHPKVAKTRRDDGRLWENVWRDEIASYAGVQVVYADTFSTDDVVLSADVAFGGFSTGLTMAVAAGKRAVSLMTRETHQSMVKQSGNEEFPLTALGLAAKIENSQDLSGLLESPLPDRDALKHYDPGIAYNAIKNLVS